MNAKELTVIKFTNAIMEECRQCVQNGVKTVNPIPNRATVANTVSKLVYDKKLYRDMFEHGLEGYDIDYTDEECLFLAVPDTFMLHLYLTGEAAGNFGYENEDDPANWDLETVIDNVLCMSISMAKDRIPNTWDVDDKADPVQFVMDIAKRK